MRNHSFIIFDTAVALRSTIMVSVSNYSNFHRHGFILKDATLLLVTVNDCQIGYDVTSGLSSVFRKESDPMHIPQIFRYNFELFVFEKPFNILPRVIPNV